MNIYIKINKLLLIIKLTKSTTIGKCEITPIA